MAKPPAKTKRAAKPKRPTQAARAAVLGRVLASVEEVHEVLRVKITRDRPGFWSLSGDELSEDTDLFSHYMALVRAEPEATYAGMGAQEAIRRDVEEHTRRVQLGLLILGESIREMALLLKP